MPAPLLAALLLAPVGDPPFSRSVKLPDGRVEVRTAVRRYTAPGKPEVVLVGAIHVGTPAYYREVQYLLDGEGSVFYEGVRAGPAAMAPAKGPKHVYQVLGDALGLAFQLNEISYDRPGWRNVDLAWSDLERLSRGRKAPAFAQVRGLMNPASPQARMLGSFLAQATPGTREALKLLMIRTAGGETALGLDPGTEEIVLKARNRVVVDALARATAAPNPPRSIAVFYGAKHLGEIGAALQSRLGYRLLSTRWLSAASADPAKVDETGRMLLKSVGG